MKLNDRGSDCPSPVRHLEPAHRTRSEANAIESEGGQGLAPPRPRSTKLPLELARGSRSVRGINFPSLVAVETEPPAPAGKIVIHSAPSEQEDGRELDRSMGARRRLRPPALAPKDQCPIPICRRKQSCRFDCRATSIEMQSDPNRSGLPLGGGGGQSPKHEGELQLVVVVQLHLLGLRGEPLAVGFVGQTLRHTNLSLTEGR